MLIAIISLLMTFGIILIFGKMIYNGFDGEGNNIISGFKCYKYEIIPCSPVGKEENSGISMCGMMYFEGFVYQKECDILNLLIFIQLVSLIMLYYIYKKQKN